MRAYIDPMTTTEQLRELAGRCRPSEELLGDDPRAAFFSRRPDNVVARLEVQLDEANALLLLLGPRGVGKTAHLNQLRASLAGKQFVISFRPRATDDEFGWDELFAEAALHLSREAHVREVYSRLGFLADLHKALRVPEGDARGALDAFAAKRNFLRASGVIDETRDLVSRIFRRAAEVLAMPIVVLADASDALSAVSRQRLFASGAARRELLPPVRLLMTVPFELAYTEDYGVLSQQLDVEFLRALPCRDEDQHAQGRAYLKEIVRRRCQGLAEELSDLIAPEALDRMVSTSAGLPRQLLQFVRGACLSALGDGRGLVRLDDAVRAIDKERERFFYILDDDDREYLAGIARTTIDTAPLEHLSLIRCNAIVEFWDESRRHPFWARNPLVGTFAKPKRSSVPTDEDIPF